MFWRTVRWLHISWGIGEGSGDKAYSCLLDFARGGLTGKEDEAGDFGCWAC